MIKWLILVILAFGLGYLQGFSDAPYEYITKNIPVNHIVEKVVVLNETRVNVIEIEKILSIPQIINITINISGQQEKALRNLRCDCNNIGCSDGCIKAKYGVYDIMGWKRPKFSEKPSIGVNDVDEREYIPVDVDGFGTRFIKLSSEWVISKGLNEPLNKQFLCQNLTFANNSKWIQNKGTDLFIRHV